MPPVCRGLQSLKGCQGRKGFGSCRQDTCQEVTPDLDLADLNWENQKGLGMTGEGETMAKIKNQERKCGDGVYGRER